MKKILIALALLASMQAVNAQVKTVDAKKALDAAVLASQDAKKAAKADTWVKLGQAYVAAHDAPQGSLWVGASRQELKLVMGHETPSSTETVQLGGESYVKEVYSNKNLYFNGKDQLAIIEVTQEMVPDALNAALEAYKKAFSLDAAKTGKTVLAGLTSVADKLMNDAYTKYQTGDYKGASVLFEKSAAASSEAPLSKMDTNAVYNAGFTALLAEDKATAKSCFETCYKVGYYSTDGDLYAKLAEVDPAKAKTYLEEGFEKFPESQSILISLINYYINNNEDSTRLFALLDKAKVNEPNNASLYYVEGNIHKQLGELEAAAAAYAKCAEINPKYVYGYVGMGQMFYDEAIDLQTKAQEELDDAKYTALVAEFEKALKSCIEPFEKAYESTDDQAVKNGVAEYLKNACYRFREQDAKYQAAYEKYAAVVAGTAN